MSERPKPTRHAEEPHAGETQPRAPLGEVARPEVLLPGASLSLGFALLLLQPHPLAHPAPSYGIVLVLTTALFLYGRKIGQVLARAPSRTVDTGAIPSNTGNVAAIDAAAFGALEKSLGLATLLEILRSYLQNAEQLIATLDTMAGEEQWPEAVRIAQDIAGAASGFGLTALTAAARSFAQQARDGRGSRELREAAQRIVGEHVRVRSELAKLSARLAA